MTLFKRESGAIMKVRDQDTFTIDVQDLKKDDEEARKQRLIFAYFVDDFIKNDSKNDSKMKMLDQVNYPYPELSFKASQYFSCKEIVPRKNLLLHQKILWTKGWDLCLKGNVYGEILGTGSFKTAFASSHRAVVQNKWDSILTSKYDRIILDYHEIPPNVEEEIAKSQWVTHLHAKPPVMTKNTKGKTINASIVMRRFPGEELFYYLNREYDDPTQKLSTKLRLDLCIKSAQAWENEVDINDLYHLDLKSENFIVKINFLKEIVESCHITDFDFAELQTVNKIPEVRGSLPLIAPEIICLQEASVLCDAYSFGVTLKGIWHGAIKDLARQFNKDRYGNYFFHERGEKCHQGIHDQCCNIGLHGYCAPGKLFQGIESEVDQQTKKDISDIISALLKQNPKERWTIYQAHEALEAIKFRNKSPHIPKKYHEIVGDAHDHALQVNVDMHEKIRLALRKMRGDPIKHQLQKIPEIYRPIKKLILSDQLNNNEYAIKEFIEVLNIELFEGAQSKEEMVKRLDRLMSSYIKNLQRLGNVQQRIQSLRDTQNEQIQALLDYLDSIIIYHIDESANHHHGIDNLQLFNHRFIKTLQKADKILEQVNLILDNDIQSVIDRPERYEISLYSLFAVKPQSDSPAENTLHKKLDKKK